MAVVPRPPFPIPIPLPLPLPLVFPLPFAPLPLPLPLADANCVIRGCREVACGGGPSDFSKKLKMLLFRFVLLELDGADGARCGFEGVVVVDVEGRLGNVPPPAISS